MNQVEIGKLIAKLRKDLGYTQQTLADALQITDKAVSKWERGICLPDSAVLPKLAGLLDTDIGTLIPDYHNRNDWKGLLIFNSGETGADTVINGKPLINYLMSYFILLGITEVEVRTNEQELINSMNLERYGISITFEPLKADKTMVVYGKSMLFGSYLTQQLLNLMAAEENISPTIDGQIVPMLFSHTKFDDYEKVLIASQKRSLYRGMINVPLETMAGVSDAERIIMIYEKYHNVNYCDLYEMAKCRGII